MSAQGELRKTKLFAYLKARDKKLSNNCLSFVSHVTPILASIKTFFPFYTRHDEVHSLNIVKQIERIVDKTCFEKNNSLAFTGSEVFLLICSAYGHDLGMAVLPGEEQVILSKLEIEQSSGWQTDNRLQEYLRRTHSERGGKYILDHIDSLGIPIHLHQQLDLMMKAHNFPISTLYKDLGKRFSLEFKELNMLQLASILCVADLLEFSVERVLKGVIDQLKEALQFEPDNNLKTSLLENMKHVSIGSNLGIGPDGQIIMTGTFKDPEVLNTAYKTVDYIEKCIRDYGDIDYRSELRRLRIRTDSVSVNFSIPGREFERLGIRMNKQSVIGLISSNAIWNNRHEVVIRELLQNSVEACRYRLYYSNDSSYKPSIVLQLNSNTQTLTISDNGCGMSQSVILNNFLTVGNSRAKEPGYSKDDYASLARFGIGFWSVFTIADSAIVETTQHLPDLQSVANGLSFEVSINALRDYILFEKSNIPSGTRITLKLKKSVNLNDLANKIMGPFGVLICSLIPIRIEFGDFQQEAPISPILPKLEELLGPKIAFARKEGVNLFESHFSSDHITINSFFIFRKSETTISFKYSNDTEISIFPHLYETTSVCGFIVRFHLKFPIHELIGDIFGFMANTMSPRGFIFDITRQTFQGSDELSNFSMTIVRELIATYRRLLKANDCYTPKEIVRLYEEGIHVRRGGIFDANDQLVGLISEASDLLCFKLYKITSYMDYSKCEPEFLGIDELLARKYQIVTASQHFSIHSGGQVFPFRNDYFYELSKALIDDYGPIYYTIRGESDLLFANDPQSYIVVQKIEFPPNFHSYVIFFVSHTWTVNAQSDKSWIIGLVQGVGWAGIIAERKILNAKFAFIHQKCFLQPGSELALHIRTLYNEGRQNEICKLMSNLEQSLHGHIDPTIEKYL